jgi:hypothetical protein
MLRPMSEEQQVRIRAWETAKMAVSLLAQPDGAGLRYAPQVSESSRSFATQQPVLVEQLVWAFAIFASELPADAVAAALARLDEDDRGSGR